MEVDFTGTPAELMAFYRRNFPPVIVAYETAEDPAALERDLLDFATELHDTPGGWGYEYLLALGTRT